MRKPSVIPGVVGAESTPEGLQRWSEAKNTLVTLKQKQKTKDLIVQAPILTLLVT